MMSRLRSIQHQEDGVTAVEFAMVAPILTLILLGLFDFSQTLASNSVLEGAMDFAARTATLESTTTEASRDALDNEIKRRVRKTVGNDAVFDFNRMAYHDYADVERVSEDFDDFGTPGDGICNNGETFVDSNGDGVWSADGGREGGGGAQDAIVYTVTVTYRSKLSFANFMGVGGPKTMSAKTILKNQPFSEQAAPALGTCSS